MHLIPPIFEGSGVARFEWFHRFARNSKRVLPVENKLFYHTRYAPWFIYNNAETHSASVLLQRGWRRTTGDAEIRRGVIESTICSLQLCLRALLFFHSCRLHVNCMKTRDSGQELQILLQLQLHILFVLQPQCGVYCCTYSTVWPPLKRIKARDGAHGPNVFMKEEIYRCYNAIFGL